MLHLIVIGAAAFGGLRDDALKAILAASGRLGRAVLLGVLSVFVRILAPPVACLLLARGESSDRPLQRVAEAVDAVVLVGEQEGVD